VKALVSYPDLCTGCRLCELACAFRVGKTMHPARSRITVVKWEDTGFYLPFTCLQCEKPACASACPVEAITRREDTGAMVVDAERCIGCGMCQVSCPFGAACVDRGTRVASKCDLCDGSPRCAEICPASAIRYQDEQEAAAHRRRSQVARALSHPEIFPGGEAR
jgi:Fe-S-cluster-containing hydrogenase component 2